MSDPMTHEHPWKYVTIPKNTRKLVEQAKADLTVLQATGRQAGTYQQMYDVLCALLCLDSTLRERLDELWDTEHRPRIRLIPPFSEDYCVTMAQRPLLYPYKEFEHKFLTARLELTRRMTDRVEQIVPVARGRWRVVAVVHADAYRTYGWSQGRYRAEAIQAKLAELTRHGLKCRVEYPRDHPDNKEYEQKYHKDDALILCNAPAWQIDYAMRKEDYTSTIALNHMAALVNMSPFKSRYETFKEIA